MSFFLLENEVNVGPVDNWTFIQGKILTQEIVGLGAKPETVEVGKDPDMCTFTAPKIILQGSTYAVLFEGRVRFNIQVLRVDQGIHVKAAVLGKSSVAKPSK